MLRGYMVSPTRFLKRATAMLALAAAALAAFPALAQDEFPFGFEMTLDTPNQPGSKRLPTLEIGDNGEAKLDFWCKSGTGQFLVATLSAATNWKRQNDLVVFTGAKPLRFHINTN